MKRRQIFEVRGPASGPLARSLGQELIKLDGIREVAIEIDAENGLSVAIVASRLIEGPEFDAAVEAVRGHLLAAS
ncbi:MAG: hypothetical protein KBB39_06940 [Phycicoccus sp.]|nr:hypothetical protein [Phycicoccus sp.]